MDRIRKLWKNNVNYNQAQKQTPFSLRLPILSPPILRPLILRPPILWELIHCLENYPVFKVIACVQNYASVTPGSHRDINKLLPGRQIYTNINKAINRDINKLWAGRRCSSSGKDWRSWCSCCSSHLNHHGVNQTLFRMSIKSLLLFIWLVLKLHIAHLVCFLFLCSRIQRQQCGELFKVVLIEAERSSTRRLVWGINGAEASAWNFTWNTFCRL